MILDTRPFTSIGASTYPVVFCDEQEGVDHLMLQRVRHRHHQWLCSVTQCNIQCTVQLDKPHMQCVDSTSYKHVTIKCGCMSPCGQYILRSAVNTACSGCSIGQAHTSNVSTKSFLGRIFNSGVLRRTEHSPPLPSYTHSPAHLQQDRRQVEWQSR